MAVTLTSEAWSDGNLMIFGNHVMRIEFRSSCLVEEEPENFLSEIAGEIFATGDDGEECAGSLRLFYVDIEGANASGFSPYEILDLHQATEPYYAACFDPRTEELKEQVQGDSFGRNLLILDRLELLPQFRGRRLGLAVLYRCVQQFAHADTLAVLKCFPLQFESRLDGDAKGWRKTMQVDVFGADQRKCTAKLKAYYKLLGFEAIGRTAFMVLDTARRNPTLEELGLTRED